MANPAPTVTSISPNTTPAGSDDISLIVTGTNFVNGSVVKWNGSDRPTIFQSTTQLIAYISEPDLATVGTANVTVFNPSPGGGTSNSATFTITVPTIGDPDPVLFSVSPNARLTTEGQFTLNVLGNYFKDGYNVIWDYYPLITYYVTPGQLLAYVRPEDLPDYPFVIKVKVMSPDMTLESNEIPFYTHTFADVLPTAWYWRWIEGFYHQGITTGCGADPLIYCPDRQVTRAEMAVFILRAKNGTSEPTPVVTDLFADVPVTGKEWMQPWIEQFYAEGITTGCAVGPLKYCPERQVTRAEMAVFLLRAIKGPTYEPPEATGIFSDVPVAGKEWMQPWIEEFYREGITTGCASSPLRYCPEQSVTRAEMATFIDRAFGFPQIPEE